MKVLTVVGRAEKRSQFERSVESALMADKFEIDAIVPLDDDEEAKRFLAYVSPTVKADELVDDVDIEVQSGLLSERLFAVELHDSPDEAMAWAAENYGKEAFAAFSDPLKASEIARRDILMGLIATGQIAMVRARFDGKPICALIHLATGHGQNDQFGTPYAIMVDNDLGSRLELPMRSSYDT
jgi:hypothetical protein